MDALGNNVDALESTVHSLESIQTRGAFRGVFAVAESCSKRQPCKGSQDSPEGSLEASLSRGLSQGASGIAFRGVPILVNIQKDSLSKNVRCLEAYR